MAGKNTLVKNFNNCGTTGRASLGGFILRRLYECLELYCEVEPRIVKYKDEGFMQSR